MRVQRARLVAIGVICVLVAGACSSTDSSSNEVSTASALPPCDKDVSTDVLAAAGPGGLLDKVELNDTYKDDPNFPNNARAWRVHYVSTSLDERDLVAVCGVVVAPDGTNQQVTTDADGRGRMFSWSHGTIGIAPQCQPSVNPEKFVWAPTPAGIGPISWGAKATGNRHLGTPENGILQYMIDRGWVVTLTDYENGGSSGAYQPYIVGKVEGANVLDISRAATRLINEDRDADPVDAYELFIGGHSQGGQAAFFAAQLADRYLSATAPKEAAADLELVGVAMDAPASNIVVQPDKQPDIEPGHGLADSEMHLRIDPLIVDLEPLQIQIGPMLFSYIFGAWGQYSERGTPDADAEFPAYPAGAAPLAASAVLTAEGRETVADVAPLCTGSGGPRILKLTEKYHDAAANRMLIPEIWNLPKDYTVNQYFRGGMDKTCVTATDAAIVAWCDWVRYNIPGPYGVNPFDKVPTNDGALVPALIAQGSFDNVVFCRNPEGHPATEPPPASDCMSRAFYDSLEKVEYCPNGQAHGYLQMDVMRNIQFQDPSDHFAIAGQIASASQTKTPTEDLRFEGSRLEKFVNGAFEKTLEPGCSVEVVNKEAQ